MSARMINVEVTRQGTENNMGVLRRFTKKVQGSGVLPAVRGKRYSARAISEQVKRKRTLKYLKKRAVINDMIKMGKPLPSSMKGRRR